MKRNMKLATLILCCLTLQFVFLSACSNSNKVDTGKKDDSKKTEIKAISQNKSYPNNSYMITSKGGTIIAADPTQVIDGITPDIITSTHSHPDHVDYVLESKSSCKKSYYTVETFSVKDVNVLSIASAHTGNNINKDIPSNVIYVYEVDGMRIAHMGDIGQDKLTDEQMKALGKIDIAFMQFINPYSDYDIDNQRGFKLIEQLKPQIIIPTHSDENATKKISEIVGAFESVDNVLSISKDDLKDGKRKVIEIKNKLV